MLFLIKLCSGPELVGQAVDEEVKSVLILLEKCLIQFQPDPIAAQDHSISPSKFTLIS
jgi:hypothetical protein